MIQKERICQFVAETNESSGTVTRTGTLPGYVYIVYTQHESSTVYRTWYQVQYQRVN
jgi:hypothetical protein